MSISKTPLVDAVFRSQGVVLSGYEDNYFVPIHHARQLEKALRLMANDTGKVCAIEYYMEKAKEL